MSESTALADEPTAARSRGQPTKFRIQYATTVRALVKRGATNWEVAEHLNVSLSTLMLWKSNSKYFSDAFKRGKKELTERIEMSLAERAIGYSHPEEKIHVLKDGEVVRVDTIRHYPPDTEAAKFWLKNRAPDRWKDRTEQVQTDSSGQSLVTATAIEIARQLLSGKPLLNADNRAAIEIQAKIS